MLVCAVSPEDDLRQWRKVFKGLLVGTVTGTCVGLVGFLLAKSVNSPGMGGAMFFLVPFCAGFAIALVTRHPDTGWAAMLLAALASLAILVAAGLEGILCAVLAFPLLAAGLVLGAFVGYLFRLGVLDRLRHQNTATIAFLALTPVLILVGHRMERPALEVARREVISNSIVLSAQPEEVWSKIQSIDSINVAKPFLMYVGLPVPLRCTLEKESVGAKRTCYFEHGFIEETITEWSPPYSMQLTIDRSNMPGRHWLGFETASYELRREGAGTRLTRTTTITSHLHPIWYWRYFERLGVAQEHDYILRDLANRLNR